MSVTPRANIFGEIRRSGYEVPNQLRPIGLAATTAEDFCIRRGKPVVPEAWCEAEAEVSAEGLTFAERPALTEVASTSVLRFLPTAQTVSTPEKIWYPYESSLGIPYQLQWGSSDVILEDLDYQINTELFTHQVMRLTPGAVLTSDALGSLADALEFTVALAVRPLAIGPLLNFADGSQLALTATGATLSSPRLSLNFGFTPVGITPLVIVLAFGRTKATLSMANSNTYIVQASGSYASRTQDLAITIASPCQIFAIDVWANSTPPIAQVVSDYTSVLGP